MGKYVITGGPGVGKTTTLEEIAKHGFPIIPEAAREIIEAEQAKPYGILPWTDLAGFQHMVYRLQAMREDAYRDHQGHLFLDRGIHDGIAYCREGGIRVPAFLMDAPDDYDAIFLLDRLPTYRIDAQRKEDCGKAILLHELIGQVYEERGYDVVRVPVLAPSERAAFILGHIRRKQATPQVQQVSAWSA